MKVNKTYFIGTKVKYSLLLGIKNGICLFSPHRHVQMTIALERRMRAEVRGAPVRDGFVSFKKKKKKITSTHIHEST